VLVWPACAFAVVGGASHGRVRAGWTVLSRMVWPGPLATGRAWHSLASQRFFLGLGWRDALLYRQHVVDGIRHNPGNDRADGNAWALLGSGRRDYPSRRCAATAR
jgi:hypothetical protein